MSISYHYMEEIPPGEMTGVDEYTVGLDQDMVKEILFRLLRDLNKEAIASKNMTEPDWRIIHQSLRHFYHTGGDSVRQIKRN